MNWYYLTDAGEVAGPISQETLEELRSAGGLDEDSQICAEGTENWQPFDLALPRNADSHTSAVVPNRLPSEIPEEEANNKPKTVLLGSEPSENSSSDRVAKNHEIPNTDAPPSGGAFNNFVDSLRRILESCVTSVKKFTHSGIKDSPPATGTTKPIDRRFITGILVAIGCTAMIVLAIISTNGDSKEKSSGNHLEPAQPTASPRTPTPVQVEYSPCGRCRGSGNLQGRCTRCRGNGTIMTGNPNSLDPLQSRIPSMQVACPQCRGGGRMAVPCTHCRGTGRN